jgi:hypothetical protein
VNILKCRIRELRRKGLRVELRVMSRPRVAADVDERPDVLAAQDVDELRNSKARVADGVNRAVIERPRSVPIARLAPPGSGACITVIRRQRSTLFVTGLEARPAVCLGLAVMRVLRILLHHVTAPGVPVGHFARQYTMIGISRSICTRTRHSTMRLRGDFRGGR